MMLVGGVVSGLVGLGTGYLTLRLRGTFFSIATLAMAVVVQTLVTNWDFVGGSRGAYIIRPATRPSARHRLHPIPVPDHAGPVRADRVGVARAIEHSRLGYGFATIRDDELAAEASGVPTLRLKLIATALSGGFMGMAGAPLPYYVTYLDPASGFSLSYAVNTIAMPLIGGTSSWLGPMIGAVLLGTLAAGGDGHDLVGAVAADRRRHAGGVRRRGAERHHRLVPEDERRRVAAGHRPGQALRRLRRAGRYRA